MRGKAYFETLSLNIYEGDEGKELPLKTFMVEQVSKYQPAIFLDLVDDWTAIEKWNLTRIDSEISGESELSKSIGETTLADAFKNDLVQNLKYRANRFSYYWKSTEICYDKIEDILGSMRLMKDYSSTYRTKSNRATG